RQLTPDGGAPPGVARVALVGHARVPNLVPVPEPPLEAVDELVIPLVVRARAAALDEQDLPGLCLDDPSFNNVTRLSSRGWGCIRYLGTGLPSEHEHE